MPPRLCASSRDYCGVAGGADGCDEGEGALLSLEGCPKVSLITEPLLARWPASGDWDVTGPTGTIWTGAGAASCAGEDGFAVAPAAGDADCCG